LFPKYLDVAELNDVIPVVPNTILPLNVWTSLAGDKTFSGFVAVRDVRLLNTGATFYVLLNSPGALGATYTFTLPTDGGTSGYVLQTNGSGTTSWVQNTGTTRLSATGANLTTATLAFTTTDAFEFIIEFDTERSAIKCISSYAASSLTILSDIGGYFLSSDAGTGVYISKTASSANISIKNRCYILGSFFNPIPFVQRKY